MEPTTKMLYLLATQLQQIINFYKHIKSQSDTPEHNASVDDNKSLASTLLTTEKEVHRIFELFNKVNSYTRSDSKTECKVKFVENGRIFLDFLSCFEFGTSGFIDIKKDLKAEKEHYICKYILIYYLRNMYFTCACVINVLLVIRCSFSCFS